MNMSRSARSSGYRSIQQPAKTDTGQDIVGVPIEQLRRDHHSGEENSDSCNRFHMVFKKPVVSTKLGRYGRSLRYVSENLALLKEEAKMVEAETLFRYIRIFSDYRIR